MARRPKSGTEAEAPHPDTGQSTDRTWIDRELRQDLRYLRKGAGATTSRLARRQVLLQFLGAPGSPEAGLGALQQHLDALGDSRQADALRNAYSIGAPSPRLLKDRRRHFLEQHAEIDHIDSVKNWEDAALNELHLRLLVFAGRHPDLYQFVAHGWLLRRHVMQAFVHDDHMGTIEWREIVALRDGLDTFQIGTPPTGRIVGADGAELREPAVHPNGLIYDLRVGGPAGRGATHTFAVRTVTVWDYTRTELPAVAVGFHEPTVFFDLDVRLLDGTPKNAWWFHQLHPIEVPGQPLETNTLPVRPSSLRHRFEMLYGGFVSGIAWRWKR